MKQQLKFKNGSIIEPIETIECYPSSADWRWYKKHIAKKFPDLLFEELLGIKLKPMQKLYLRWIYGRFTWFDKLKHKMKVQFHLSR